jgi:hypothetical protein
MRAVRLFIAGAAAVAMVPLAAGAASAAPPDNDEYSGARVITLGDTATQDTTEATLGASDAALSANCFGVPPTNNSVWYQYTADANRSVAFDASASDYSVGIMIFQGTPTADGMLSCGPEVAGADVQVGQTYFVMAFDDSTTVGGNLSLTVRNAPAPHAHLRLAKRGIAYRNGAARLHGTYSCRHNDGGSEMDAHLYQRAGRLKIQGDNGTIRLRCDGVRRHWSLKMISPVGTYAQGRSNASASIFVCGLVSCTAAGDRHRVRLVWARSSRQLGHPTASLPRPRPSSSRFWAGR